MVGLSLKPKSPNESLLFGDDVHLVVGHVSAINSYDTLAGCKCFNVQ